MNRVVFLIDGFNFYHSLDYVSDPVDVKKYHKYKWIDYSKFVSFFLTTNDKVEDIFYFTALATWNPEKVARHEKLIKALRSKDVKIILSKFRPRDRKCGAECKQIYETHEEKQTDVRIASTLLDLAINDKYDKAIIVTGDNDLVPAIRTLKKNFPQKRIGVLFPINRGKGTKELNKASDFKLYTTEEHLKASQLPDIVVLDAVRNITIEKPSSWN